MQPKKQPKNWIKNAIGKPGQLHHDLGLPLGHTIPEGRLRNAARQGGIIGKRARLAITLKKMNRGK